MTPEVHVSRARRLVILGGGMGGTAVAKRLANDPRFEITLVDRQNHFVFQPLLYQVATAALGAADIAVPIRHLLRDATNVAVLQSEVRGIRTHARLVDTDAGPLPYDTLVVATGVEASSRGVEVRLDTRLTDVTPDGVTLGTRWIPAANVIWAAGVRASPLGESLPVERDAWGRVKVAPDCSIPGHPEVFVIGDLAHFEVPGKGTLPAVGGVALQMGNHVARLLKRELLGRVRRPFAYFDRGQMATIGRNHAIAEVRKLRLGGRFAWWAWLGVHIVFLAGFRNRVTVLLHWAWSYVTYERGARLILLPGRPAAAPRAPAGPGRGDAHDRGTRAGAADSPDARPLAAAHYTPTDTPR